MLDASERIKDIFDVSMEDIAAIDPLEVMSGESRELIILSLIHILVCRQQLSWCQTKNYVTRWSAL